ncbi:MAG TPA: DNA polymerase III subunit alpha [Chlamydiales bacterium]|nr:DNA polymerase III subunit alpha [Chlamydiales bacterium]
MSSWIPLHQHSQFSILDSTASVKKIVKQAKKMGMSSLALTDSGNMYGAVNFYKVCKSEGIKPIIGSEVYIAPFSRTEKKRMTGYKNSYPVILLVKDKKGYQNLCKLSSAGFTDGFYYRPRIDKELLKEHCEGLICLSGPVSSLIGSAICDDDEEKLLEELEWFQDCFKEDFYFEVSRHHMSDQDLVNDKMKAESWVYQAYEEFVAKEDKVNKRLIELGKERGILCVATNDSHYLEREDWRAHEILLNIQSGEPCVIWERDSRGIAKQRIANPKRKIYPSHEFYFKSPEQMGRLFEDVPEAVTNTVIVADKCHFELDFQTKHYPVFYPPHVDSEVSAEERQQAANDYLYQLCVDAIPKRYPQAVLEKVQNKYPDKDPMDVVKERLEGEYEIISSKGMCDYLLIVWDFINWAKRQKIPVGPGRGSAAGSILAYLMGITDIEPLQFNLFFERFINPERLSYPDIDVDICMERRQEVIDYTIQKYGSDKVAQIITFGTMKAKMAIRDVGRVLSVPLSKVDAIAKLVPDDLNITLEKALEIEPEFKGLYDEDEEAKMIIDMALKAEGSIRNTGIHAAGLIVSATSLTNQVPVCTAKDATMLVTQYAMKPVESVGMLKIDFLGLKTLTSIQKCVASIDRNTGNKIDWGSLPLDDKSTFNLLNQGKTLGVFQLESGGMQSLARQLHIDLFEEIIAVGALYRPGPMDMIPSFINRKHGREKIEIDHPLMKDILLETYGVMVYQEQVMQIASKLAGYSLGEGDVLRRAMGKKDHEEMVKQRKKFVEGALEKDISEELSSEIFDKIEKFASYGFNKSHATAYAYVSYVTAFMKANYPHEWMAALMTCDRDDITKVAKFIRECQVLGIPILSPDINEAGVEFVPTKQGIRFAMSGIKGVGVAVVEAIVKEREKNGEYTSLQNFIERVDKRSVGKKNIELLIDAGSFDFTKWSRDALKIAIEPLFDKAVKAEKEKAKGIIDFFAVMDEEKSEEKEPSVMTASTPLQLLQREKELLGFFLTAHPMDSYRSILKRLSCVPLSVFDTLEDGAVCRSAFIVDSVKIRMSNRTQKKFAILIISDGMNQFELPIWSNLYDTKAHLLVENQLLYAILQIEKKEGQIKVSCRWIDDLTKADEEMIKICDDQFEKLQHQARSFQKRKFDGPKPKQDREKEMEKMALKILIDANELKLSDILSMKNIFLENPGKTPIDLHFSAGSSVLGSLNIDESWGVEYGPLFEKKLKQIVALQGLELVKR